MELVYPRSDEKRLVHLHELVSLATEDLDKGRLVLPFDLYKRLVATEQKFLAKFKQLSKAVGQKMEAVAARNKAQKRLTYLVLDVFVMARRKCDRGDLKAEAMTLHCIPKGTVYERGQPGIWSQHAKQLLAGDAEWTKNNPSILLDPTREILETADQTARTTRGVANRAIHELGIIQAEMQTLRKQVTQLLAQARYCIVGAFYHLDPPKLRELLFAYGYRFRTGRSKRAAMETQTQQPKPQLTRPLTPKDHAFTYDPSPTPAEMSRPKPATAKPTVVASEPPITEPVAPAPQPLAKTTPDATAKDDTTLERTIPDSIQDKALRDAVTLPDPVTKPKAAKQTVRKNKHTPSTRADREKKKMQRQMAKNSRKKK